MYCLIHLQAYSTLCAYYHAGRQEWIVDRVLIKLNMRFTINLRSLMAEKHVRFSSMMRCGGTSEFTD